MLTDSRSTTENKISDLWQVQTIFHKDETPKQEIKTTADVSFKVEDPHSLIYFFRKFSGCNI